MEKVRIAYVIFWDFFGREANNADKYIISSIHSILSIESGEMDSVCKLC